MQGELKFCIFFFYDEKDRSIICLLRISFRGNLQDSASAKWGSNYGARAFWEKPLCNSAGHSNFVYVTRNARSLGMRFRANWMAPPRESSSARDDHLSDDGRNRDVVAIIANNPRNREDERKISLPRERRFILYSWSFLPQSDFLI